MSTEYIREDGHPVHVDDDGFEHHCRWSVGEWVAKEFTNGYGATEHKAGKVEEIRWDDNEGFCVRVTFRFTNGPKPLWFNTGLRKMRWTRRNGRPMIQLL